jgi:subtilase family serine protease
MLPLVTKGRSAAIVALAVAALALAGISGATGHPGVRPHALSSFVGAFTSLDACPTAAGISCYTPAQIMHAYGLDQLQQAGIDGSGTTIAVIIPFGSPTIAADLQSFDQTFGLPDPQLTITKLGNVPAYDPTDADAITWAEETTIDVEWSHVVAPKANILLVETAVDETEGVQGFPEIEAAEKYVADNDLADVIVQTYGATEQTFPSTKAIMDLRDGLQDAARHNITVVNASGDTGTTNFTSDFDFYPIRVNGWPSADPLVTSVGGTKLTLDASGNRLAPDVVWNDSDFVGGPFASGGGLSSVFKRPKYQNGVKNVVGNARGTPDISMSAALTGALWVQLSFDCTAVDCGPPPFYIVAGTSVATPLFGGIVALADQVAGQRLGEINDALYSIPYGGGLVDVTDGNNDPGLGGAPPGYDATTGYDLASGLGTVDPLRFVPALAALAGCGGGSGNGQGSGDFEQFRYGHDDNGNGQGNDNGQGNGGCRGDGRTSDCTSSLTFAAFPGDLHVKKGATCSLTDSAVGGNVKVEDGATLVLNGVTLDGDLNVGKRATCTATGGANFVAGKVKGPGACAGL